jgi:hypothetical protein
MHELREKDGLYQLLEDALQSTQSARVIFRELAQDVLTGFLSLPT